MYDRVSQGYQDLVKKYLSVYDDDFDEYPHQRMRFDITKARMKEFKIKKVLDVGCGSCVPILQLVESGYDAKGIDVTKEMILEGQKLLAKNKVNPGIITQGDIYTVKETFDCIVNLGAFPTCIDDNLELQEYRRVLNKNGKLFVEHRNELFCLFTLNSYTMEFFKRIIPNMPQDVQDSLAKTFNLEEPKHNDPYHRANPRLHNPLKIVKLYQKNGFRVDKILFYHYHYLPPMFESQHPEFNEKSLMLEKPEDWKGYFMASAYVVEATKI